MIYTEFKALDTAQGKVEYLTFLKGLNLPYEINYDNLILYWGKQV
jgi:hypothetical protein